MSLDLSGDAGSPDASTVTYTPTTGADWPDPDPGNVDGALDQLASRTTTLEAAGSGGGYPHQVWVPVLFPSATSGTWTRGLESNQYSYHRYLSSGAQNEYIEWPVLLASGTWRLDMQIRTDTNRGIATAALDGSSIGTMDGYAGVGANLVIQSITGITVASEGVQTLRLTMATKHASSSAYYLTLSMLVLTRTGA